ncbi:MAG: hypothetical protein ACYCZM_03635 [Acidimicrobiales bacterium]
MPRAIEVCPGGVVAHPEGTTPSGAMLGAGLPREVGDHWAGPALNCQGRWGVGRWELPRVGMNYGVGCREQGRAGSVLAEDEGGVVGPAIEVG